MRFVPFRFNSLYYQTLHPYFFIYDFSIKFNLYRFSDLPHFENLFAAVLLPFQASKIACFSIFSELFLYQFQVGNSIGARSSKTHNCIFFTKHLDFSSFISYMRFILIFPDTRNLLTKPYSGTQNMFIFRIKDFPSLYNFIGFRLDYVKFFPTFHFFAKSSSSFMSSDIQTYMLSFFSTYFYKNTSLFS